MAIKALFRFISLLTLIMAVMASSARAGEAQAQDLLDALQEISGAPGLSAAVSKDDIIIWTGQAGAMDAARNAPAAENTRFRIASVSKLFATTLALQLSEQGHLDLDDDIRNYVPNWPAHDGATITLRQLAAHISGIAHYGADDRYDATREYSSLNASLAVYAHKPLLFPPGEAYNYSSYGYALMGAAIENVTGASFEENLASQITTSLLLKHTSVENIHALPPNTSRLYARHDGALSRNDQRHVVGATGILSTPRDLVAFADAYMRGDIVSLRTVDASLTPARLNNGEPADAGRFTVGFGWRIGENWEGEPVFHHAGVTPGARSILTVNRTRNLSAALLSNASWTSRIETTGELIATAAAEQVKPENCPTGEWSYEGFFASDPNHLPVSMNARGTIGISAENDLCRAVFTPQGELAAWLEGLHAGSSSLKAVLVAERSDDDLIFAVATPWGAFPLRFSDKGATVLKGDFAGRTVNFSLHQ